MKKTNLKVRIIPTILFYNYMIVKSREFDDYRTVGNLEQTVGVYNRRRVDELIILDIGTSKSENPVNIDVLRTLSKHCLMPVTYGGGITKLEEIAECLAYGCDKVLINTSAIGNDSFIAEAVRTFGSQCIVIGIDYVTKETGERALYSHSKEKVINDITLQDHLDKMVSLGIGELCLTSVSHDGWMKGMDEEFAMKVSEEFGLPIILNGGAGSPEHMGNALEKGASAVCGGSIFLYSQYGYQDIKNHLRERGIPVREQ